MNKRKFVASFSVRIGTRRARIELSPAELHGGPEGAYRVRIDRRWYDLIDGGPAFLGRDELAQLLVKAALDGIPEMPPCPQIKRGARVTATYKEDGVQHITGGYVEADPVYSMGQWVVPVCMYEGMRYIPVNDLIVR